jgi:hypothetical protein
MSRQRSTGRVPSLTRIRMPRTQGRRKVKKTKRAADAQASAASYARTVALIYQQQVGVKGFCQSDGSGFSVIEA